MYDPDKLEYREKKSLVLIFFLITFGIVALCSLYLYNYSRNYHDEAVKQLVSITELKKREIVQWRKDRTRDASLFINNTDFSGSAARFISNRADTEARKYLLNWIGKVNDTYGYRGIDIYDGIYRKVISYPRDQETEPAVFSDKHIGMLKSGEIVFNDFYRDRNNKKIYLMIFVPVFHKGKPACTLTMRIDPEEHIYPLIRHWPVPSRSAETLLVRREGDYAVFLNEVRFSKNSALNLRLPLTREDIPSVRGALGFEGVMDGTDYRGIEVTSSVRHIPDSAWIIVARIDKSEINEPLVKWFFIIIAVAVLLIAITGGVLIFLRKQKNLQLYRNHLNAMEQISFSEKEKRVFSEALEQSLNEIYIFDSETYIFRTVNRGGQENTGYTIEELRKMTPLDLNSDFTEEQLAELIKPLIDGDENIVTFDTFFIRKNGSTYPAKVHLSINRDEKLFIGTVIDITANKQMVTVLEENMLLLQTLIETIPEFIWLKDTDGNYLVCNPMMEHLFGAKVFDIVGKTDYDFLDNKTAEMYRENDKKAASGGVSTVIEEWVTFAGDGGRALLEIVNTPMKDSAGKLIGVLGVARDITERKVAEETLQKSEKRLREAQEMAHLGYWIWDVRSGVVEWTEEVYKIFGLDPSVFTPQIDSILALSPWPGHHERNVELIKRAVENHQPGSYEQKFLRHDNSIGYYYSTFQGNYDENGDLVKIVGTVLDITAQKLAEEALRESEARYRIIFENINDAFIIGRPDGTILSVNPSGCMMFGRSEKDMIELGRNALIDYTDQKYHMAMQKNYNDKFFEAELTCIRADGTRFPAIVSVLQFTDTDNRPAVSVVIRDITLQKEYEEALLLRSTAMDHAANAIFITDTSGIIQYVNPAFEFISSYTSAEAIGHNPRELIKSGMQDSFFYKELWDTISSGLIWSGEIINRKKDGIIYTEEMTIAPVKDSNGKIKNYVAIKQDVTERKLTLDLLRTRVDLINFSVNHTLEEFIVRALDEVEKFTSSSISFFHFVEADQITLSLQTWSTATRRSLCKTADGSLHKNIPEAGVWVDCVRQRKGVIHNDYRSLPNRRGLPEGHAEVIREIAVPVIRDELVKCVIAMGNKKTDYNERDMAITSYFADVVWDTVERKSAEEYLKKMNLELEVKVANRTAELEKANRELESFSYSVSHDLRAPVRHIVGFLEMFRGEIGDLSNTQADHYLTVIDKSARRMWQLIDDLLEFSRLGRTLVSKHGVDLETLITDVLDEYSSEIERSGINIIRHPLPYVKGDRSLLRVVFVNLISNAVKFTGKNSTPEIEIGFKTENNENIFFIRDNGAGFDMRYADKLFGVFQRLHNEREFAGTGIGLAMVRNIIERHDGRIWAESKPGIGASFYFVLPLWINSESIL